MSFLSPSNKIASLKDGKIVLEKNNLEAIVNQAINQNKGEKSLPLAVISVLGSEKSDPSWQKLHTDWIIYYHEQNKSTDLPSHTKSWEASYKLQYFNENGGDTKGEIYMWPMPFNITQTVAAGQPQQMLCWIVYIGDDLKGDNLLEKFAACVSSKLLLWNEDQREDVYKFLQFVEDDTISSNKELTVPSSCLMLLSNKRNINRADTKLRKIGEHFLKNDYEMIEIEPMVTSSSETLTLENFSTHLKQMASKVNSTCFKQDHNAHLPKVNGTNFTQDDNAYLASDEYSEEYVNQEFDYLNDMYPEPNNNAEVGRRRKPSKHGSTRSMDTEINFSEENSEVGDEDVNNQLKLWISNQMTILNISQMCAELDIEYDSKSVLAEFQKVVVSFNNELQNMFDNYVCYHGDLDEKIMGRLGKNAIMRFQKGYQSICVKISGSIFKSTVLKKIPMRLYKMYSIDNKEIVQNEKRLSENVITGIRKVYTNCMLSYHGKTGTSYTISELKEVHRRMVRQAISIISHCMDYNGRLNTVLLETTQNVQVMLEEEFSKHKHIVSIRS